MVSVEVLRGFEYMHAHKYASSHFLKSPSLVPLSPLALVQAFNAGMVSLLDPGRFFSRLC